MLNSQLFLEGHGLNIYKSFKILVFLPTNKTIKFLRSFFQKATRRRHSPYYLYNCQADKLRMNLADWVILPHRLFLTKNKAEPQKLLFKLFYSSQVPALELAT